jgi:hypothetical protein
MKGRTLPLQRLFAALALLTALCQTPGHADYQDAFVSGREWTQQMSAREKFMSLLPPAFLFSAYEVRLRHSLPQYIGWIDAILEKNPELQDEEIGNVFASTVFLLEPENREALSAMETDFLRGDYETRVALPRLSIELPESPFRSE